MGDAIERIEHLIQAVGDGDIVARNEVNQAYAQIQHENLEYSHPRGGRAKYLEGPLYENYPQMMQTVADSLITRNGSDIAKGMTDAAEQMSKWVEDNAPRLDNTLRYSSHIQVTDNGNEIYDRPPKKPRRLDK